MSEFVRAARFLCLQRTEFALTPKEDNEAMMSSKVREMRTRGRTACYKAIHEAAAQLKVLSEDTSKWVVALTDGKDTESADSDVTRASELFKGTEGLNFALISLGNEVDRNKVDRMVNAAKQGGNTGMLVPAQDMAQVKQAFEEIASAIMAPAVGAT